MKKRPVYHIAGEVWLYPGDAGAWHFVSVDQKHSADIRERFGRHSRGFGSLPVSVTIGKTTWQTSIFPDSKSGTYLLPIKAIVRKKEGVRAGEGIRFTLVIR